MNPPAPIHLDKVGREAFARYLDILPDFPSLVAALSEVEQLQRRAFNKSKGEKATPGDVRLFVALTDARLKLLAVAGLTPKSRKQITGTAPVAVDHEGEEDEQFLDS